MDKAFNSNSIDKLQKTDIISKNKSAKILYVFLFFISLFFIILSISVLCNHIYDYSIFSSLEFYSSGSGQILGGHVKLTSVGIFYIVICIILASAATIYISIVKVDKKSKLLTISSVLGLTFILIIGLSAVPTFDGKTEIYISYIFRISVKDGAAHFYYSAYGIIVVVITTIIGTFLLYQTGYLFVKKCKSIQEK